MHLFSFDKTLLKVMTHGKKVEKELSCQYKNSSFKVLPVQIIDSYARQY